MEDGHNVMQLIDGDGGFNAVGLDNFVKKVKLSEFGVSYAVVSIMGPQSSGKSTLMNHLFHTKFREMNSQEGRSQTTQGIWISECVGMEPFTIVMDLEGNDGKERGQEIAFEKQAALFAMAISDILLINIWCHDIGREQASNKPLIRTIFEVMMRLFSPRKTTLLFVVRDKTKTPLEILERDIRNDMQKIWDEIPKPESHRCTLLLTEVFNVHVCALSSYEEKEESFKAEIAELRKRFFHSISPGRLAGDRQGIVAASGFSLSTQNIWKMIKENKDLDLPSQQVMVSTVRCEEIASQKFSLFMENKDWLKLSKAVEIGPVEGLGKSLSSILNTYTAEYDMEANYFDEAVRISKRQLLEKKAFDLALPVYLNMIEHLRSKTSKYFKARLEQLLNEGRESFASSLHTSSKSSMLVFDEGCADATMEKSNWDASTVRKELELEIDAVAKSIRNAKLFELKINYEKKLSASLNRPIESLLKDGESDAWASIRNLLNRETESVISDLTSAVAGFEIDEGGVSEMVQNLKDTARNVVVTKAREEAGNVLRHMIDRFARVFLFDNDIPVVWKRSNQLREKTEAAYNASLKLLSVMAAICLDEKPNNIEEVLFSSLMSSDGSVAPLASTTWAEVSARDTLIEPVQCKPLWRLLKEETTGIVNQANLERKASKEEELKWLREMAFYVVESSITYVGKTAFTGLCSMVQYVVAGNADNTDHKPTIDANKIE